MFLSKKSRETDKLQYEFLPSALEIAEMPNHPLGSFIIYFVFFILLAFITWASFSKVDVVVTGRGKLVPVGNIKIVQAIEEGVISGVFVEEGDKVKRGDTLVSFDNTLKELDEDYIKQRVLVAKMEKEILDAYLRGEEVFYLESFLKEHEVSNEMSHTLKEIFLAMKKEKETEKGILLVLKDRVGERVKQSQTNLSTTEKILTETKQAQSLLSDKKSKYLSEKNALEALEKEIADMERELSGIKEQSKDDEESTESEYLQKEKKLEEKKSSYEVAHKTFMLTYEGEEDFDELESRYGETVEKAETNWKNQGTVLKESRLELEEANYRLRNFEEDRKLEILNKSLEKQKEIEQLELTLEKARKSLSKQSLISPVDGMIQQVSPSTVGAVVKPADAVVTIVPKETPLIIEAYVENKDIGYIQVGQRVNIKVDTYSYQKYGLLEGVVEKISPDAIEDEKRGLVYKIKVSLKKSFITQNGRRIELSPGMAVVTEIKIGDRRIIEFLLEPLVKHVSEAFQIR